MFNILRYLWERLNFSHAIGDKLNLKASFVEILWELYKSEMLLSVFSHYLFLALRYLTTLTHTFLNILSQAGDLNILLNCIYPFGCISS